jgi:hypothetical protein
MSIIIEVHKMKAVRVSGEWMEIGKSAAVADEDCEFENEDEEKVGELSGGVLSFKGGDGEDYVVCLADVEAVRMR